MQQCIGIHGVFESAMVLLISEPLCYVESGAYVAYMYFEAPRDKYHQDTTQILSIQEMGHSYQYECGGCWTRRTLEPLIPTPSVRVNSESVPCATAL